MCRNITTLRGLEPAATPAEVTAAALQYVRKVSGISAPSGRTAEAVETAVRRVAEATNELLGSLPPRNRPPPSLPPLRRRAQVVAVPITGESGQTMIAGLAPGPVTGREV